MHEDLWAQALADVLQEAGLDFSMNLAGAIQGGVDAAYATTASLMGVVARPGTQGVLNYRAQMLGQRITRISDTTRSMFQQILGNGIQDNLTPVEMAEVLRSRFPQMASWRTAMIARTEMGMAADAGRIQGLQESEVVTHVSVIGCEAREAHSPSYRGESTCNISDVPIEDAETLDFHPNHTGCIVPSRMRDAFGEEVELTDEQMGDAPALFDEGAPIERAYTSPEEAARDLDFVGWGMRSVDGVAATEYAALGVLAQVDSPYSYSHMNHYLRAGALALAEQTMEEVTQRLALIDAAIARASAPFQLRLYLGSTLEEFGIVQTTPAALRNLVGRQFTDPGYMLTSVSSQVVTGNMIPSGFLLTVRIPVGHGAMPLFVGGAVRDSIAPIRGEGEVLLPRGTSIIVRAVNTYGPVTEIMAEAV